jgi:hypothetical protein
MPVAAIIEFGDVSVDYPDRKWSERHNDLTEVSQTFQRATRDALEKGDAFPGLADFYIRDLEIDEETEDCFVFRARGIGTSGGVLELPMDQQENDEGWDEATRTFITTNPNQVRVGQSMTGYPSMKCVSVKRQRHPRTDTHWNLTASYRGLLSGVKEPKIRWTSSGREISKESLINGFPGGWNDPRRSQVLWPRQGCTISYVSLSVPNVPIPQQTGETRPHPQAPFVYTPNVNGPVTDFVWQWPNGWVLLGMETDIIPGTTLAFVTENWVYNDRVVFG